MKRTWIVIGTVTLVAALAAAPFAWAHQQAKRHEMSPFMTLEKLRQLRTELDLTDAQLAELRAIRKETREANAAYRASLRDNFAEAGLALLANPDDIAKAEAILDRNEAAKKELRANVLDGVADAIKVLTPEQREKLTTVIDARKEGF
ncbi:MAG: periplasmic heavy metal sensor [Acidobacteria bacterium]|nr:periplasmic heavy metal sensor [Acidobacteriota bacterium]